MELTGVSIGTRRDDDDAEILAIARRADELGYHTLWTAESWGRDAFTILTMIACNTGRIRLGTGIVAIYSRTPTLLAQTVASLDVISRGRAVLGLGTSGRGGGGGLAWAKVREAPGADPGIHRDHPDGPGRTEGRLPRT